MNLGNKSPLHQIIQGNVPLKIFPQKEIKVHGVMDKLCAFTQMLAAKVQIVKVFIAVTIVVSPLFAWCTLHLLPPSSPACPWTCLTHTSRQVGLFSSLCPEWSASEHPWTVEHLCLRPQLRFRRSCHALSLSPALCLNSVGEELLESENVRLEPEILVVALPD